MEGNNVLQFKQACEQYLSTVSLGALRSYGRTLQLKAPTKYTKSWLVQEIIKVLCGESKPQRDKKGAPIKSDYIDPKIIEKINALRKEYNYDIKTDEQALELQGNVSLQLSINPSALTKEQKQLLNNFLNSL